MDEKALAAEAVTFYFNAVLPELQRSRLHERREALMAGAPHVYGLRLWVNGLEMVLLDDKGFLCATREAHIAISLCRFESQFGPGSTRAVLNRDAVDPYAGVFFAKALQRKELPPNVPEKAKRPTLTPSLFLDLLKEL